MKATQKILVSGSALFAGLFGLADPASAQQACDLNGVPGSPLVTVDANSLTCGLVTGSVGPSTNETTLGQNIHLSGDNQVIIGYSSVATDGSLTGFAPYARPAQAGATAVGAYSLIGGTADVAVGDQATVGVFDFAAFGGTGVDLTTAVTGGTAVGSHTLVTADDATAIGYIATATGAGSTALGFAALSIGANSTALGNLALTTGANSTAVGNLTLATGANSTAMGNLAVATGANSAALGNLAVATGANSVALGNLAASTGASSVAIGDSAFDGGFANSVALGAGSTNTAANQVAVGGRTISGVNAGAVTATSTEAVNGSQLYVSNQNIASNTAAITALSGMAIDFQDQIDSLGGTVSHDRREAQRGVAAAVAMSEAPMPSRDGGISYSLHGAAFRGEYAVGGSMKYRLNRAAAIDFGVSHGGGKNTAIRAGISGEL